MDELKPCQYCEDFESTGFEGRDGNLQMFNFCPVCGKPTNEIGQDIMDRRATTGSKPLTLEQLREMKRGTFEVRPINPNWEVCGDEVSTFCFEEYLFKDYGKTWLAYARKPEGSEKV